MSTKSNIIIDQGADYINTFDITHANNASANLETYTATAYIRKHYASTSYYTFTANTNANGVLTISMTANNTANIPAGRYVYDCVVTSNTGTITRLIEGIVTVNPSVTR